eukprot:scaffold57184_cov45-Phaeocystis_antarctica.AAC.1
MHVQVAAAHLHVAVLAERGGEPLDRRLGRARLAAEDRKYAHRLARTAATHFSLRSAKKDRRSYRGTGGNIYVREAKLGMLRYPHHSLT